MITIANANALHIPLPDRSVQCIVTSPPYWALRSYLDNDDDLKHMEIGLENTPAEYVAHIVAVMRECWRVLKDDGTLWINLGDSYAGSRKGAWNRDDIQKEVYVPGVTGMKIRNETPGLKPKDLCGIPWLVAFALQDDGWYLRSDIIWHKPNPMPESVTDRPTKAHEYVFLLTKQARYFYDAEAIKEAQTYNGSRGWITSPNRGDETGRNDGGRKEWNDDGQRNRRSVWTIATSPYSGAHFAVWPPKLIEPMILAGTSARGECPQCGKAWVRVVETVGERQTHGVNKVIDQAQGRHGANSIYNTATVGITNTIGWRPSCACPPHDPIPQTVLDPFAGSGTTGQVAVKHGRRAVLLDLNTKYIDLQFERTNGVQVTMPL